MRRSLLQRVVSHRFTLSNYRSFFVPFFSRNAATQHPINPQATTSTSASYEKGPGRIASDLEQSTGLEREEYLLRREGKPAFFMEVEHDFYGTRQKPAYIPSAYDTRIVGCSGFPIESHDYVFFELKKEEPRRCPECGQYFVLQLQEGASQAHHH